MELRDEIDARDIIQCVFGSYRYIQKEPRPEDIYQKNIYLVIKATLNATFITSINEKLQKHFGL